LNSLPVVARALGLFAILACQAQEHDFVPPDEYEALARGETAAISESGCADGHARCGSQCRDVESDPSHCGECGSVCDSGVCLLGTCLSCRSDERACDGACVAVESDAEHCGGCGLQCGVQELCSRGVCTSACRAGSEDCNGGCVDLGLDPRHCGECGNGCPEGRVCSAGKCRVLPRAPHRRAVGSRLAPPRSCWNSDPGSRGQGRPRSRRVD
jgi:hypothetical protein